MPKPPYRFSSEEIARAYSSALEVQDACNLSGVVYAFARAMDVVCAECQGTDEKNHHPIVVLFMSKLNSMMRGLGDYDGNRAGVAFAHAYGAAIALTSKDKPGADEACKRLKSLWESA